MKRNIYKIIVFALTLVMLFGSLNVFAFESYDTYTYSIDGEPLKSPAAYTPDFTTYDSEAMGLFGGNNWGYHEGEIGIWEGNAMHPITYDNEYNFVSEGLKYALNEEGTAYAVTGLDLDAYIASYSSLLNSIAQYKKDYPLPEKENATDEAPVYTTLKFSLADIPENAEVTYLTYEAYVKSVIDAKIAEAIAANPEGQPVYLVLSSEAVVNAKWIELFTKEYADKIIADLEIPAYHDDLPVSAIADNAFTAFLPALAEGEAHTNEEIAKKAIESIAYAGLKNVLVGRNVDSVGQNIFKSSTLDKLYHAAESESDWIGEKNSHLKKATYYYSNSVKYGNTALSLATDIVSDKDGNIYVVDKDANRVVVLNKRDFKIIGAMGKYTDEYGNEQTLNKPNAIYVTNTDDMVDPDKGGIFVCDTENNRIVVFDTETFAYKRTIEQPDSSLLEENDFQLHGIAVDIYGRIFAISHNCHEGVIVLSNEGEFTGFIGAQKVTVDPIQQIWNKLFTTAEQRAEEMAKELPEPFNNITVDEYGFVYVTINFTKEEDLKSQLTSIQAKTATYSPIKKLNSTGVEIMKRNGFFDPGGEVVLAATGATTEDLSKIIDVSVGDEGSWSLLDSKRSRVFTYDSNGNLLFAFGDNGDQIGNGENYVGMTYQVVDDVYNLVLLDNTGTGYKIIVYHPTEYCDAIMSALHNENVHNHHASIDDWQTVLTKNNNFDLAYIGMGKALYNLGEYDEAMEMLSSAYEVDYYSKAFAEARKKILSVWMIPLIIGVIALLLLFFKFLGYAKKKNKATSLKVGRKSYWEEMLYAFHLVFHPFDGFWDLKHEKRGSVRAASTILGITVVAFFYQAIGQGYMFNQRGDYSTVFLQVIAVLVPVLLWVVSNWCLTTLFDGEGSLKDIYIATCYSLAPLPLFVVLSTILSNVFTASEGSMVTLLVTIGYIWVGLLLFFGMSVTHDYPTGKNVITILGTIVAMAVIMFIAILFSSLVIKMVTFLIAIFTEIFNRF